MFGVAWKSFWELLSWSDSLPHLVGSLGGEVCFPPFSFSLTLTVNCFDPYLHPVTSVEASGGSYVNNAVWPERFSSFHPIEPGHDANLEAAEELWLADPRSPSLVPVHGSKTCWQHGLQHREGWVDIFIVNISAITQRAHCHVQLQMLSHSLVTWFSVFAHFFLFLSLQKKPFPSLKLRILHIGWAERK